MLAAFKMNVALAEDIQSLKTLLAALQPHDITPEKTLLHAWVDLESEILSFEEDIRSSSIIENRLFQEIEDIYEWCDTTEEVVTSVYYAENKNEFNEAYQLLQVKVVSTYFRRSYYPFLTYR